MNIVCFMGSVIILMLYSVPPISSVNMSVTDMKCLSCSYSHAKKAPPPELLWANTTSVVLRARLACSRWCHIQWYMDVPTLVGADPPFWNWVTNYHCYGQEYCVLNVPPDTSINVSTALWSDSQKNWIRGETTLATVCPESPPPAPKEVTCSLHQREVRIRWLPLPDACRSYAEYMVRFRGERSGGGAITWLWIGEAPSGDGVGRGGEAFAGDVRPCGDNTTLLCADLTSFLRVTQVQLGIRRMDSNTSDEFISKTEFIDCWTNKDIAGLTQNTTTTTASSSLECIKEDCTVWRSITFLIGGALIITVVLIPLSYIAGVRCERFRGNRGNMCSSTSRQHIDGNRSEWNGNVGTQELICNEVPPAYNYDYTYRDAHLPRNQPALPPLPEEHHRTTPSIRLPPLPRERHVEVQNDMYISELQK